VVPSPSELERLGTVKLLVLSTSSSRTGDRSPSLSGATENFVLTTGAGALPPLPAVLELDGSSAEGDGARATGAVVGEEEEEQRRAIREKT
jgi:hypothetical protein